MFQVMKLGEKQGLLKRVLMEVIQKKKKNTFVSIFPTSKPKFILAVMLDEPKSSKDYVYSYRDGSNIKYKGTPFNTAGWTAVEVSWSNC